jgi:hypothetical protein
LKKTLKSNNKILLFIKKSAKEGVRDELIRIIMHENAEKE